MLVRELLNSKRRDIITASPTTKIHIAMDLLIRNHISCLPVITDNNELVGIISDKDIFKAAFDDCHAFADMTVSDLMTSDVIVGLETDTVAYIAGIMTQNRFRHVPIVDGSQLIGLVSIGDVVKSQLTHFEGENRYLWHYINGTYPA